MEEEVKPRWGHVVPGAVDSIEVAQFNDDSAMSAAFHQVKSSLSGESGEEDLVDVNRSAARPQQVAPQPPNDSSPNLRGTGLKAVEPNDLKTTKSSWIDMHLVTQSSAEFADKEPWRRALAVFVNSTVFNVFFTSLIVLNSVIMGVETEFGDDTAGWMIVEILFLVFYSVELLLRLVAHGIRQALQDRWVYFDTAVVVVSIVDVCIIEPLSGQADARTMALVLRTLRLMKLARIIRLLRFFKELWLLVSSFISAFKTLTWTFLLLVMVIYVFGIIFVRLLGKETTHVQLREYFGTLPGAMFTLFQIATLEGWPDITRMVWETDQWYMSFLILAFLMVTTFSIMNTVLAVIVEHTLSEAIEQRADMIKKNQATLHNSVKLLADIYNRADVNGDGMLSKEEFVNGLMNPKSRKLLQGMELGDDFSCLDKEELAILFDTIDVDDSCELTPQEFVKGLVQMRGAAKARGVFELRCDMSKATRKMQESLKEVREQVQRQHNDIVALDRRRRDDFESLASRLCAIDAKLDALRGAAG